MLHNAAKAVMGSEASAADFRSSMWTQKLGQAAMNFKHAIGQELEPLCLVHAAYPGCWGDDSLLWLMPT